MNGILRRRVIAALEQSQQFIQHDAECLKNGCTNTYGHWSDAESQQTFEFEMQLASELDALLQQLK